MKRTALIALFLLIPTLAKAAPVCRAVFANGAAREIVIQGLADPGTSARIKKQIEQTREGFESIFGAVNGDIKLVTEGSTALRTGYNFKEDSLQFPKVEKVRNNGLDSVDVVNHELFHLMICRRYPALCPSDLGTREELQKVHEALADYFAYKLNPDAYFGENYHADRPYLRRYESDLLLGLTSGAHAEANVLVRFLIRNRIPLEQIQSFLKTQPNETALKNLEGLSPAIAANVKKELNYRIEDQVLNLPESKLRRYRLQPDQRLELAFTPSESLRRDYPDLEIKFQREDGSPSTSFLIQSGNGWNFTISPRSGAKAEKLLAVFMAGDKILGMRSFYFGTLLPGATSQ